MTTALADPDREAATRRVVQTLSYVALLLALAGAVLGINGRMTYADGRAWAGTWVLVASVVLGIGCVRHGMKNEHERGRVVAGLAIFAGGVALAVIGADVVVDLRFYSREPAMCCMPDL